MPATMKLHHVPNDGREEDFPRGGLPLPSTSTPENSPVIGAEGKLPEIDKKAKRDFFKEKAKMAKAPVESDKLPKESASLQHVDNLTFKSLSVGTKLLGSVSQLKRGGIVLSLPNGLSGFVNYSEASDVIKDMISSKKKQIEAMDSDTDEEEEESNLPDLKDLFTVGTLLPCVIIGLDTKETANSKKASRAMLSLCLSRIHNGMAADSFHPGTVSYACVKSLEDHGYILSFGVPNVSGFLRFKEVKAADGSPGPKLVIGQTVPCLLGAMDKTRHTISCRNDPQAINSTLMVDHEGLNLQGLQPGQLVSCKVQKMLTDGLSVSFLSYFSGTVDQFHLESTLPDPEWKKKYTPNLKLQARIVMVDAVTKNIALSLNRDIVSGRIPEISVGIGELFSDAIVRRVDPAIGLLLELTAASKAAIAFVHISGVSDERVEKLEKKFRPGQKVKGRVIGHRPMDGIAIASLKESVLKQTILREEDAVPGMLFEGTVMAVERFGALVRLADGIRAFCPTAHMADTKVTKAPSKFQVGATLRFRVLTSDLENRKLVVTHKKTMVASKLPLITSFEEAVPGTVSHGWITGVKDYGLFISFYGSVRGLAHRSTLGLDPSTSPQDAFVEGQVVKCKVVKSDPEGGKISLSLNIADIKVDMDPKPVVQPGQIVEATVESIIEKGVVLAVQSGGFTSSGYLAKEQLSDSFGHSQVLYESIKPGHQLSRLLVLSKDHKGRLELSGKRSLLEAVASLPCELSQLTPGQILPGFVANVTSGGCFVRFLGRLTGLAVLKNMWDDFVSDARTLFKPGQSVRAQILEVDEDSQRFTVCLNPTICRSPDASYLSAYFAEEEEIAQIHAKEEGGDLSWAQSFPIGSEVSGEVQEVKDYGVIVNLDANEDIVGFATHFQVDGPLKAGDRVKGRVLEIGKVDGIVDLSLKELQQESVGRKKRKTAVNGVDSDALLPGTAVEAIIELVKDEYLVVTLPKYGGTIAFAATKDYNRLSVDAQVQFLQGDRIHCVVAREAEEDGRLLLLVDESKPPTKSHDADMAVSGLQKGKWVHGKVLEVKALYMDIQLARRARGRIYISDLAPPLSNGSKPLSAFHEGQQLKSTVVGQFLVNGSEDKFNRGLARLSTRPPTASKDSLPPESMDDVAVGQAVTAFVKQVKGDWVYFQLSHSVAARLFVLDTSTEPSELKNLSSRFQPGQVVHSYVQELESEHSSVRLSLSPPTPLQVGQIRSGRIGSLLPSGRGLSVQIGLGIFGNVSLTELSDSWLENPLESMAVGQFLRCRVLAVSDSGDSGKRVDLSVRESLGGSGGPSSVPQNDWSKAPRVKSVEDISPGMMLCGYVKSCSKKGCFVAITHQLDAFVLLSNLADSFVQDPAATFPPGRLVHGRVLSVDPLSSRVEMTLKLNRPASSRGGQASDVEWLQIKNVEEGLVLQGTVKRVQNFGAFVSIDNSNLTGLCHIAEMADEFTKDAYSVCKAGDRVTVKVIKVDQEAGKIWLTMKQSAIGEVEAGEEEEGDGTGDEMEVEEDGSEEEEGESSEEEEEEGEGSEEQQAEDAGMDSDREEQSGVDVLPLAVDLNFDEEEGRQGKEEAEAEEDRDGEDGRQKKRRAKKRDREAREAQIQAAEEARVAGDVAPQSIDDFERLLLASPNSSFLWIKFMAHLLTLTEVDKARAVAERAIATINYREESEKLNVWVAYLNLENMYGEPPTEAVLKLFQRGLQYCDTKKLHLALLGIYERSDKQHLADDLLRTMTRKFKTSCKIWARQVQFYLSRGQDETAHKVFERSLLSLAQHKHIKMISRVALMYYKSGYPDRGRMLFESVLRNFPKRTDLWSQYIDQESSLSDLQRVRSLFERVTCLHLSVKKMKFLFKKFLDFEKVHGTEQTVDEVKRKAMAFVENKLG